jgi:hypothetical protein
VVAALSIAVPNGIRSALHLLLAALAALTVLAWPSGAGAQSVGVQMQLCDSVTGLCPLQPASPGQLVYYEVTIASTANATITLANTFDSTFTLTGVVCGNIVKATQATINLQVSGQIICRFSGFFNGGSAAPPASVKVVSSSGTVLATSQYNAVIDLVRPLPSDVRITKTQDPILPPLDLASGPNTVTYKIVVENLGANDLFLGRMLEVQDRLRLKADSVALNVLLDSATCQVLNAQGQTSGVVSDCLDTSQTQPHHTTPLLVGYTAPHDFAAWHYPPGSNGFLKVGEKIVLTVTVKVSAVTGLKCIIKSGADGFWQEAHVVLTLPAVGAAPITVLDDLDAKNNTAEVQQDVSTGETVVNADCNAAFRPKLAIRKTQVTPAPSAGLPWSNTGTLVTYRITVENLSTTHKIRNIHIRDAVEESPGTPPFKVAWVSDNCATINCSSTPATGPQQLQGYGDFRQMFSAVLFGGSDLAPATVSSPSLASFLITLRYSEPRCDSFRDGAKDPIRNIVQAVGWDEVDSSGNAVTVNDVLQSDIVTAMAEAPACPLLVTKKPGPGQIASEIEFGVPYNYAVTYENPTGQDYEVGSLIDAMRFVPWPTGSERYAISLRVDYNFQCTVAAVPGGMVSGYPAANSQAPNNNIAYIVGNVLPQQGARLIDGHNVTFKPHSKLACTVNVIVRPPAASDPYCSRAVLDNAAILDMSVFYNPNLPWPTVPPLGSPAMWASFPRHLPNCHNWVANKFADPSWTWWTGPMHWRYTIYNGGPSNPVSWPLIRDRFTNGAGNPIAVAVTGAPFGCAIASACIGMWYGPAPTSTPSSVSALQLTRFDARQKLETNLDASAPASVLPPSRAPPGGSVCNTVTVDPLTPSSNIAAVNYWKNPDPVTRTASACVRVLDTGLITIRKLVTSPSGLTPPGGPFAIDINCVHPDQSIRISAIHVSLAAGQSAAPPDHIPVGSKCTASESGFPPLPAPTPGCAYPYWHVVTTPLLPFVIPPADSAGNVATSKVTVLNELSCRPVTTIIINKTTIVPPGMGVSQTFAFVVTCNPALPNLGPLHPVTVPAVGQTRVAVPIVSKCTVAETVPVSNVQGCSWTASPSSQSVNAAIPGGTVTVKFVNQLVCNGPGTLSLRKTTNLPPGMPPLFASVTAYVTCGGHVSTVKVPANGAATPLSLPAPVNCTIIEQAAPAPSGCSWSVTYVPSASAAIASGIDTPVQLVNDLVCNVGATGATLLVRKFVLLNGDATPRDPLTMPAAWQAKFPFTVTCGSSPPQYGSLNLGNGYLTALAVPANQTCKVQEQPPAFPDPACHWSVTYPQGPSIPVVKGNNAFIVHNVQVC